MMNSDLEFRLSEYLDGTLGARESAQLEQRLLTDRAARELLGEYQRLDAMLKTLPAVPEVDFDALSARIAGAVDEIEAEPQVIYSFKWVRQVAGVAVAACVTLGVGLWMSRSMTPPSRSLVQVQLPQAEVAAEPAVAQVSIGTFVFP